MAAGSARQTNRAYFRRAYRSGRHGWATETPSPYAVRCLRRLKRLVPRGRMLDLGCGEGRHAIAGARMRLAVTAVDYEPLALARARRLARRRGVSSIAFRRADALRLPFAPARFDIVLDYGCLHHQTKADWPAYKAGLLRVLRPGGYYLWSVFSRRFFLFRGRRRPWHLAHGAYRRRFTARNLRDLFGREFQVLDLVEQARGPCGAWYCLMRRRA
jgi:SAM-dependent methyltransferase